MGDNSDKRYGGRGDKKHQSGYKKKRRFHGNQYTSQYSATQSVNTRGAAPVAAIQPFVPVGSSAGPSTSAVGAAGPSSSTSSKEDVRVGLSTSIRKLRLSTDTTLGPIEGTHNGYRVLEFRVFTDMTDYVVCRKCHGSLRISEESVRGLGFKLSLVCENCEKIASIPSCKQIGPKRNAFEINSRSIVAMRLLGHGLTGLQTFCGVMDLPPPVTQKVYDAVIRRASDTSEHVAKECMARAVKAERQATQDNGGDNTRLTASGDGTWRKQGHSSLQSVTTLIGHHTQRVLDVGIKNLYCQECVSWENKRGTEEYVMWNDGHAEHCKINHTGSSGKMESQTMIEIFQRSESLYGVKYINYIGDGDSSTYKAICNSKPYGDVDIIKKECIGHVQKRMGTRLRNLKKEYGRQKLEDGHSIGGKGRLTNDRITELTTYYGNAIRGHCNDVTKMYQAIWATWYHKRSTDEEPNHKFCPEGKYSWCIYNRVKAQGGIQTYRHTKNIPATIMDLVKPIYEALSTPELLTRCLGGFTQNSNESLNQKIWKIATKKSWSGLETLKFAAYLSVATFNEGNNMVLELMKQLDIQPGKNAMIAMRKLDEKRIFMAEKKKQMATKEARTTRKRKLEQQIEEDKDAEDSHYSAGTF